MGGYSFKKGGFMKDLSKKFLSRILVVLFVIPQFSFATSDFQSKEKSVVRAYKRVSISLASNEFNDVQREQYLEAFKAVLLENEVTKEEFEKIALSNKWVPESFDFTALWSFVRDLDREALTKADGSYDLNALKNLAQKGSVQFFRGETGSKYDMGQNETAVWITLIICAAVVGVAFAVAAE